MSSTERVDGSKRVARARQYATAAIVGVFLLAVGVGLAMDMPPVGLVLFVALAIGLEYAANSVTMASESTDDPRDGETLAALESVVQDLSTDLGIEPTDVIYTADAHPGVGVLGDGDRTVMFVSGPLFDLMDEASVRGIIAHELAHDALGHLRRIPLRDTVAHVVGVVVLWTLILQGLPPGLTVFAAAGYLVAGLNLHGRINAVFYYGGSLGLVLVPIALDAYASRLEECQADDVAVGYTDATTFCTGLYKITSASDGAPGGGVGSDVPTADERTLLDRIVASYPSTERRIARQGLTLSDVSASGPETRASGPVEGAVTD